MGWLKKYTFREPILAWTFYWVGAGNAWSAGRGGALPWGVCVAASRNGVAL
jgi:hypothetical protein